MVGMVDTVVLIRWELSTVDLLEADFLQKKSLEGKVLIRRLCIYFSHNFICVFMFKYFNMFKLKMS